MTARLEISLRLQLAARQVRGKQVAHQVRQPNRESVHRDTNPHLIAETATDPKEDQPPITTRQFIARLTITPLLRPEPREEQPTKTSLGKGLRRQGSTNVPGH
jgi:hypothetical protein